MGHPLRTGLRAQSRFVLKRLSHIIPSLVTLPSGTKLGPYEVLSAIGAGGMGEVYRAHDSRLGRDVALKVLPDAFNSDPERLARFEQEARAIATLNHPNIVAVYDIGEELKASGASANAAGTASGTRYIVTELLEGETLRTKLSAGALPVRRRRSTRCRSRKGWLPRMTRASFIAI